MNLYVTTISGQWQRPDRLLQEEALNLDSSPGSEMPAPCVCIDMGHTEHMSDKVCACLLLETSMLQQTACAMPPVFIADNETLNMANSGCQLYFSSAFFSYQNVGTECFLFYF